MRRTELTVEQILVWADAFHARTGKWPEAKNGRVWEPADENWRNIDNALRQGLRGLHRGQSLARLLAKHRGKRNRKALPKFTIAQILTWADSYLARKGTWPHSSDGLIEETNGETWWSVDMALRHGQRGMPGGSSLARLLAGKRRVPNRAALPRLTVRQILQWSDELHRRTGNWPNAKTGPVDGAAGETWLAVDQALKHGNRGLRPGSSLAKLLGRHRHVVRHVRKRLLTAGEILSWADSHFARTGKWPRTASGPIPEAPGETWQRVHNALIQGRRGLPGGESLAHFVATRRKLRTKVTMPKLTQRQILDWARSFHRRRGYWPTRIEGPIPNSHGETWSAVDSALKEGRRGLPRKSSLSQLIRRHFSIRAGKLARPKERARPPSR
jgi:hypothetical protein